MEIHFKFWEFQSSFWRIHDSIGFFSGLNEVASFFFTWAWKRTNRGKKEPSIAGLLRELTDHWIIFCVAALYLTSCKSALQILLCFYFPIFVHDIGFDRENRSRMGILYTLITMKVLIDTVQCVYWIHTWFVWWEDSREY